VGAAEVELTEINTNVTASSKLNPVVASAIFAIFISYCVRTLAVFCGGAKGGVKWMERLVVLVVQGECCW
jgi:hypothetical protein